MLLIGYNQLLASLCTIWPANGTFPGVAALGTLLAATAPGTDHQGTTSMNILDSAPLSALPGVLPL